MLFVWIIIATVTSHNGMVLPKFYVSLTARLITTFVHNQIDTQFFFLYLFIGGPR